MYLLGGSRCVFRSYVLKKDLIANLRPRTKCKNERVPERVTAATVVRGEGRYTKKLNGVNGQKENEKAEADIR